MSGIVNNFPLIEDVKTICRGGALYVNLDTGEEVIAASISDVISSLRDGMRGTRRWINVGRIDAYDLRLAGFRILRAHANPNSGEHGDWCLHPKYGRKRRIGTWATLIAAREETARVD